MFFSLLVFGSINFVIEQNLANYGQPSRILWSTQYSLVKKPFKIIEIKSFFSMCFKFDVKYTILI